MRALVDTNLPAGTHGGRRWPAVLPLVGQRPPPLRIDVTPTITVVLDGPLRRAQIQRRWAFVACVIVVLAAVAARVPNLSTAYDIQVDELTYSNISQNLAFHHALRFYDAPFFVHPPGFFFIEAVYLRARELAHASFFVLVSDVRRLAVAFGVLSAAAIFILIRSITHSTRAALAAGLLFATDPFTVRITSLGLLEGPAFFWVLCGYCALVPVVRGAAGRRRRLGLWTAGIAFALALLTKETTFFLTIVPLIGCGLFRRVLPRRDSFWVAGVAAAIYSVYPVVSALTGHWADYQHAKLNGIQRVIGAIENTGYNQPNGPSFLVALKAQVGQYTVAYALIAIGLPIAFWVYRRGSEAYRLASVFAFAAYVFLGYAIANGTLEEQFFYFLVVPAMTVTVVGCQLLVKEHRPPGPRLEWDRRPRLELAAFAALVLMLTLNFSIDVRVHSSPDNGYQRLTNAIQHCVLPGTTFIATTFTGQLLLGTSMNVVQWKPIDALRRNGGGVVLLSQKNVEQHYQPVSLSQYRALQRTAQLVASFDGRSFGRLQVYDLPGQGSRRSHFRHGCLTAPTT